MAKTSRHLVPRACSFEDLHRAWRQSRQGRPGLSEVAAFEYHLEAKLLRLQAELAARTYEPRGHRAPSTFTSPTAT